MLKDLSIPWNTLPEGKVVCQTPLLWVVRTGVVVNKPKRQKKFEDGNILLSLMEGETNSVLGYVLQPKKEFHAVFCQESYVSFLAEVEGHTTPKVLYKDQKVYLYRFNSNKAPSYWFLVRNRITAIPATPEVEQS